MAAQTPSPPPDSTADAAFPTVGLPELISAIIGGNPFATP